MAYTAADRRKVALKLKRDAHGHFIPRSRAVQKVTETLKTAEKDLISQLVNIEQNKTTDDTTLVDVKITNPLRRITQILENIKKHQSTQVDLKFTIPLIALPIVILGAFTLGRFTTNPCESGITTMNGVIYQLQSKEVAQFPGFVERLTGFVTFFNPFAPKKVETVGQRIVLVTDEGKTVQLISNASTTRDVVTSYTGRRVFVTGDSNHCTQTLSLKNSQDIELFPSL